MIADGSAVTPAVGSQSCASDANARVLLASALAEAQATVRAYDTKAQIVGVGYLFAMNLVVLVDKTLPTTTISGVWAIAVAWLVVIAPALMFGNVLRPSRAAITGVGAEDSVLYVIPDGVRTAGSLCDDARNCDPCREYANELMKLSALRELKRRRFNSALYMATLSFAVLFTTHLWRAV
jgi:hypothetical protein